MNIIQVSLNLQSRKIFITYRLSEDIHIRTEATAMLVDIEYIALVCRMSEQWRSLYDVKTKQTHVTFDQFRIIMENDLKQEVKWVEEFKLYKEYLSQIEEDTGRRHLLLSKLPVAIEELVITDANKLLMDQITSYQDLVPIEKKSWTLLYVVKTTLRQEINGEIIQIIKLGITKKEIEDYKNDLYRNYENKIQFSALFAKRLYCPGKESLDIRYFHNKLLKSLPENKLYLRASNNEASFRTEFYYMTKEWVEKFYEYLLLLLATFKEKYDEVENNSDEELTDREEDLINKSAIKPKKMKQSKIQSDISQRSGLKEQESEQQQSIILQQQAYQESCNSRGTSKVQSVLKEQNNTIISEQKQQNKLKISVEGLQKVRRIITRYNIKSKLQQRILIHAQIKQET